MIMLKDKSMPTAHLICGSTGAGKTRYAMALAERTKGVLLSMDEWMSVLFIPDRPNPPNLEWAIERTERCERQMWAVARQVIARGIDVVLDWGLSRVLERDRVRTWVAQAAAESKLHYLDVGRDTRLRRVLERNRDRSVPHAFELTEAMFDQIESWFESPTEDELYGSMILSED
jgi:predicted kinase